MPILEKYKNTEHFICAQVNLIIQKLWFKYLCNITLLSMLYWISFKHFCECLFSSWYVAGYPGPISSEKPATVLCSLPAYFRQSFPTLSPVPAILITLAWDSPVRTGIILEVQVPIPHFQV